MSYDTDISDEHRPYVDDGWFIDEMDLNEISEAKYVVMARVENCKVDMAEHKQRARENGEDFNLAWLARCDRFIARQRYLEHMLNQRGASLRREEREQADWRNRFQSFLRSKKPDDYARLVAEFENFDRQRLGDS